MTRPKPLRLVPLDISVDLGMVEGTSNPRIFSAYQFGMDERGTVYLIYTSSVPRLSVEDPAWSPNCGLRYIEWVTP